MPKNTPTADVQRTHGPQVHLTRGHALPFFAVETVNGSHVSYNQFWQQRNVVLVSLSSGRGESDAAFVTALTGRREDFDALHAACVVTYDAVAGVPQPGAVIADRWGEVQLVAAGLPELQDLLDTLEYVQQKCPECEGESR